MVETSTYSSLPRQSCLDDFWALSRGCPRPQLSPWTSELLYPLKTTPSILASLNLRLSFPTTPISQMLF